MDKTHNADAIIITNSVCVCDTYRSLYFVDAPVFGVSLETAVGRSQVAGDGIQLPTVFRECIDYLEQNGELRFCIVRKLLASLHWVCSKCLLCIHDAIRAGDLSFPGSMCSRFRAYHYTCLTPHTPPPHTHTHFTPPPHTHSGS